MMTSWADFIQGVGVGMILSGAYFCWCTRDILWSKKED